MPKEKEEIKNEEKKEEKPAEEIKTEPVKKEEKVEAAKTEPAKSEPAPAPAATQTTQAQTPAPAAKSNNTWLYVCCGCLGCFTLIILGILIVSWIFPPFGLQSLVMSLKGI